MRRQANIPAKPGVYALIGIEQGQRVAYVGVCANLRHRAAVWDYNFRKREANPEHITPVRNLPHIASDNWSYLFWPKGSAPIEGIRKLLRDRGFTLLNEETREYKLITFKGKEATFADHARAAGIAYSKAYARFKKGKALDEVFG